MTGMVFSFLDLNMTPYLFLTQGTLYYYLILAFIFCVFFDACRRKLFSGTKPVITCFVDAICFYPQYFRLSYWHENGLDVRGLIENVKKSSGLSDFGGDEMGMIKRYQPLLTTGVKQSGVTLSPFGVLTCAVTLEKLILIRLKMVDYINRHPSILNIKLKCPVFVVGFPRTGTTFLHELLGLHPSVRMHHLWEQMYPVPETHDESMEALTADRTQRHFKNWFEFKAMLSFGSDEIQSIHRVGYDEPEECTLPCAIEAPYNTMTIPFLCFVAKQVADLGAGETFHLYRKYLQVRHCLPFLSNLNSHSFLHGKLKVVNQTLPGC